MPAGTPTLYAGPGKLYFNSISLFPEGDNGAIKAEVQQEILDVSSGFHGRMTGVQAGLVAKISLTPFDSWGALATLFPTYLGVTVGASTGALAIGAHPHNVSGGSDLPGVIWTPDGRSYTFPRCAITKHPDLHLGVDKALFGGIELTALVATGKSMGSAGALYTIVASAAADPGGQMTLSDFQRGAWTGVWGTATGFGGDATPYPIEAEDGWTITSEIKYSALPVQKMIRAFKLDSVKFMAKVRPYGPTHPNIDAALAINSSRLLGSQYASSTTAQDLVLTNQNSKTITLKKADVFGAGFEFGGTKLGNGEIGFVNTMQFTAGVAQPLLAFSA
jgi:hypothetical protein